jgi:plastocyanin
MADCARCSKGTPLVAVAALVILALLAPPVALAKDHKVSIQDLKFSPKELKVKKGDTVIWTNSDDRDHTVTADEEKGFKSGNLGNGKTFKYKFDKVGKYTYHCEYHPRMKATIVVEE